MPSASRVSAACFIVGQSDWLPMMIATGFPAIDPSTRPERKAGDYREGRSGGKAAVTSMWETHVAEIPLQNEPIGHGPPAQPSHDMAASVSPMIQAIVRCKSGSG